MAAVKAVYGFRIKPGRFEDWRAMSREGEKLAARLGAGAVRAMMPMAAGPETPLCYSTIDFTSTEAWGAFLDRTTTEIESQLFVDRMFGHLDSPAELLYSGLVTEIPLESVTGAMPTAPVLDVYVTQPRPGRALEAVAFGNEIAPIVMNEGARAVHLYVSGPAGSQSGQHVFVVEHADAASLGRLQDAGAKPELADLLRRVTAADAPFDMIQHSVMREVLVH